MVRISRREGIFLMLGASQAALLGAASAALTYDDLVNVFGPDVVSYWKFQNNGDDQRPTAAHATIATTPSSSPELNVDTIVDLDTIADGAAADGKCIAWPGTAGVFAEVPHNAAHKTPQGTIVVNFQHDSLGEKSTLVAADRSAGSTSSGPGGVSLEVQTDGSPRAFLRRQSDGQPVILVGQAGDVQLNEAYTLIFKWGSPGLSVALWDEDGTLVRRVTNALTDGITGTSPIRFGLWHDGLQSAHDGPFGRVIWLKRRISDGEEAILARARTISRPPSTGEYITTPEVHGWANGNTVEQNSDALRAAVANAAANASSSSTGRGVVEFVQGKTYLVRTNSDTNGTRTNKTGVIVMPSNVELRTQGKPTIASGNQAIIKNESWAGKTGLNNRVIIKMDAVNNCVVGWITLDGNKQSLSTANLSDGTIIYNQGGNGALHGLMCFGCSDIRIEQVRSRNNFSDGFIFSDADSTSADLSNIVMTGCWAHNNRRSGLTVARCKMPTPAFDNFVVSNCRFSHQGDDADLPGERPGANADLESDNSGDDANGITLINCEFDNAPGASYMNGNNVGVGGGAGLVFDRTGGPQDSHIKIQNLNSHDNNFTGISYNIRSGGNLSNAVIENCVLTNNGASNGLRISASSGATGHYTNITMTNVSASQILFSTDLPATGHSVTIWKGDFNPNIITNGKQAITINNGFPS